MKTQLYVDTEAPKPKTHTIRIHFNDTPQDQALYAALSSSSDRECRTQLPRHIKYLLGMAMGLIPADLFLLKRLGFSSVDPLEFSANAATEYLLAPSSRPCPTGRPPLRLV